MSTWTKDGLDSSAAAEELQIASSRPDGTLRPHVTMWVVRAGDDLYLRPAYGPDNPWFRRAKASATGRIRAGGLERHMTFAEAEADTGAMPLWTQLTTPSTTGTAPGSWVPSLAPRSRP